MTAVLIRNLDTVEAPIRDDGGRYRFEMVYEGGRSRAYADTAAELLDVLIYGYEAMPDQERLAARVRYATGLLAPVQARVLQRVDQTALSEAERAVLLAPRVEPVPVEEWDSEAPLVLLDVHYTPWSDLPAPVSTLEAGADPRNLWWLRATTEMDLLLSLDRVGLVSLAQSNDHTI